MAEEMMVLIRFGGNADDLLPRWLGAVNRWRKDDATKDFAPPIMAAHMKTEDGLFVMNLFASDEEHKNFGEKMGPHLQAEGLTRPWIEHYPGRATGLGREGWGRRTVGVGLSEYKPSRRWQPLRA
jgi:hypothetical protein